MDMFPEVRARIEAVLTSTRMEGHWILSSWEQTPFAIIINEDAILSAVARRDPGKKFQDLDTILETTGVVTWGYADEFEVCPGCNQVVTKDQSEYHHICESKEIQWKHITQRSK